MLSTNNQNHQTIQIGQVNVCFNGDSPIFSALKSLKEIFYKLEECVNHGRPEEVIVDLALDCKVATRVLVEAVERLKHTDDQLITILRSIEAIHDRFIDIENKIEDIIKIRHEYADLGLQFIKNSFPIVVAPQTVFKVLSYEWALKKNALSLPYVPPHSFGGAAEAQKYIFTDAEIDRFFNKYQGPAVISISQFYCGEVAIDFYSMPTKFVLPIYRKFSGAEDFCSILLNGSI